jgi:8-amino-7-oxononanoate synthase
VTVVDFTSSLYLGFEHPSDAVPPWRRLTAGAPAALREPSGAPALARRLAALVGGERGLLMPSTLHLFVDLFLNGLPGAAIFRDEALYPVACWGIALAEARGTPTTLLPHLGGDTVDARWLRQRTPFGFTPVIVTDGFCTGCGREAPLRRYVEAVERAGGGLVVVDDTQALGVLGSNPSPEAPFGIGGGGAVQRQGLAGAPAILVGASLAKAFGVPLAVLVGPAARISALMETSETRVHTSPPAAPLIEAAKMALLEARRGGAILRGRLARHIAAFRQGIGQLGLEATGGLFPVQSIAFAAKQDQDRDGEVLRMHQALAALGVRTVVSRAACRRRCSLTFVIRANHRSEHVARAVSALRDTLRTGRRGITNWSFLGEPSEPRTGVLP